MVLRICEPAAALQCITTSHIRHTVVPRVDRTFLGCGEFGDQFGRRRSSACPGGRHAGGGIRYGALTTSPVRKARRSNDLTLCTSTASQLRTSPRRCLVSRTAAAGVRCGRSIGGLSEKLIKRRFSQHQPERQRRRAGYLSISHRPWAWARAWGAARNPNPMINRKVFLYNPFTHTLLEFTFSPQLKTGLFRSTTRE